MADVIKVVLTIDDSQMSVATQRVGSNLRSIQTAMQRTADSTQAIDRHFNGLSGKFRDLIIVGGLLRFAMYDIRDVFSATIGKVIESSAQIERMTVLMKGLSNATTEQGKALDAIQGREFVFAMAKNAPFEVGALTDAFVKLKAAGLDPMDGKLQSLVDSVAKFGGSSEQLKRASVAIQQMAGKGVISMEELRQQLGEAIPTAMRNMAEGMGMSMSELVDHISKGEVGASEALRRMFTVMKFENAGAAEELNETWIGQMEKLKTNFTLFTAAIGNGGFFEAVTDNLKKINEYFESSAGKDFAVTIGVALNSFINGVSSSISFVMKYGEEIKSIAQLLILLWGGSVIKNGITGVTSALSAYTAKLNAVFLNEQTIQNTRIANQRAAILLEAKANNDKIFAASAASKIEITNLANQYRIQMALQVQYEAQSLAAQKIANTGRLANGTITSKVNIENQRAIMRSMNELAIASGAAAAKFAAAESAMAMASTDVMIKIRANNAAMSASLAGVGVAATGTSVAIGALGKAFNLMGGWITLISVALTAGIAIWSGWGSSAKEAADKATHALAKTKAGLADLNTAQEISAGLEAARQKRKELNAKIQEVSADKNKSALDKAYELKGLASQYATQEKIIKDGDAKVTEATNQGQDNYAKNYSDEYLKSIERANKKTIDSIRNQSIDKITALRATKMDEKEKAKKINDEVASATAGINALNIIANNAATEKLQAEIKKNTDKNGKAIDQQKQKTLAQLKIDLFDKGELFRKEGSNIDELPTAFEFTKKDKDAKTNTASQATSKIQTAIDAIKSKTEELKAEAAGADGTMARLLYDLNNTDKYSDTGKKGVKIPPSSSKKAEIVAALATQNQVEALTKSAKDQADYINRTAADAGDAFDSLANEWVNGQAKYQAALDNYESNTATASTADEKMLAGIEQKRIALQQYLDATSQSAENAAVAMKLFNDAATQSVDNTRAAEALKQAQSWKKEAEQLEISMIQNGTDRARAEGEIRLRDLQNNYDAQMKLLANNLDEQQKLKAEYDRIRAATERDIAIKSRTPLEQMGEDWKDVTTQMQSASVGWANKTIDEFMKLATTGKASFSDLTESILTDILRMKMQEQLSGVLTDVFGTLEDVVGKKMGGMGKGNDGMVIDESGAVKSQSLLSKGMEYLTNMIKGTSTQAGELTDSLGQTAVEGVVQAAKSSTAGGALTYVANAANAAAQALSQIAANGGGAMGGGDSGGGGFLSGIFDAVSGFFGGGGSVEPLADFIPAFTGFASGGIMSDGGSVSLRKYANGGIANSPQLALYGEGSMSEAYVPLPDGRSIPVTMSGGGGGSNVTVNIINNASGTEATQKETQNPDGSTSIDVIIQQVEGKISQNISKGRGSLSSVMEKTYGLNRATGSYR